MYNLIHKGVGGTQKVMARNVPVVMHVFYKRPYAQRGAVEYYGRD